MSAIEHLSLPKPASELQQISAQLSEKIIREIENQNGAIGFDRYMQMALYEPGLGYYSAGLRKFGVDGDFITAPEVSRLFSLCLANQCMQILEVMEKPVILEFGAGSGRLACDLLSRLQRLDCLPEKYLIMETSADLRQRQQQLLEERLPEFFGNIVWLDQLPEDGLNIIVIANEVIDALPFHRIVLQDNEFYEQKVTVKNNQYAYVAENLPLSLKAFCNRSLQPIRDIPVSEYVTEVHVNYSPWLRSINNFLSSGVVLLVDYGYSGSEYYSPERCNGTLLCHYRHRVHDDPFWYPGLQDITSSVNFSVIAEVANECGLEILGYTSQSGFLLACGLDKLYQEMIHAGDMDPLQLSREIRTLTMPGEMGERFRVMALGKNIRTTMQGFGFKDLSYQL